MTGVVEIDGWSCLRRQNGDRVASWQNSIDATKWSQVEWSHAGGFKCLGTTTVPPLVLEWLLKPRLRGAYCEGWADRNGLCHPDPHSASPCALYLDQDP